MRELTQLGKVQSAPMFGEHGLFVDDLMFALVTHDEMLHLKVDHEKRAALKTAEMKFHGKRPCHQVPLAVMEDAGALLEWTEGSVAAAGRAKPAKAKSKSRR